VYSKELVPFAAESERDWTSGDPRLFGPSFLKEALDYLQQLQLVRKMKEKPAFHQPRPVHPAGEHQELFKQTVSSPATISSHSWDVKEDVSCWEAVSRKEMTINSYPMHTRCVQLYKHNNCQLCVGQIEGYGVQYATFGKSALQADWPTLSTPGRC